MPATADFPDRLLIGSRTVATLKLGVLVSGRGSNLGAMLDAIREGRLDAEVCVVVSNRAKATAVELARAAGIRVECLRAGDYADRAGFDGAVVNVLRSAGVEWVALAGFMRLVTPVLLRAYEDRILNVHPSLLPAFPGLDAVGQALEYGVKVAGCSVHFVSEVMDSGPVIGQRAVQVEEGDSVDALSARILVQEHELYVEVLQAIAEGRVRLEAPAEDARRRRVKVLPR